MAKDTYNAVCKLVRELGAYEIRQLQDMLANLFISAEDDYVEKTRFANGYECPHCGAKGKGVTRFGKAPNGRPRFRCAHCGKTFSATTNTVTYNSKKSFAVWNTYVGSFLNGDTVAVAARKCGVSEKTAWRWRIKICDSLQSIMDKVKIEGVAEADETYFPVSFKGNHKTKDGGTTMPVKPKKRGWSMERDVEESNERYKRGLSSW